MLARAMTNRVKIPKAFEIYLTTVGRYDMINRFYETGNIIFVPSLKYFNLYQVKAIKRRVCLTVEAGLSVCTGNDASLRMRNIKDKFHVHSIPYE